jgi:manganese efflux pump family protein
LSLLEMITVAVALGTDAFSVAIVVGMQKYNIREIFKISGIIALFHIFMPLSGLYGAYFIEGLLKNVFNLNGRIDYVLSLVGSGLLLLIGFYMVIEKWLGRKEEICYLKLRGWGLMALALSLSIDSLSVGISLGMLGNINSVLILLIGLTAGLMMATGLYFGSKIGHWIGDEAQIFGGLALILLGLHFSGLI